jgi:hypothetical protein
MTIYYINGKPHIEGNNAFKLISDKEVYDLLESDTQINFEDVIIND